MKILIAPDKFKGSLTSFEACHAIAEGIQKADTTASVSLFPMADGGDGFATVMQHYLHTITVNGDALDPLSRKIPGHYQWNETNKTAIIELAVASGLVLLKEDERNPMLTSTYGTGLLIKDAIKKGARKIILGLGGSATNDGGMGILAALGFKMTDANNNELQPTGENLLLIKQIVPPGSLPKVMFQVACDVQNPLYGPNGAAYIYGPQKGATDRQVKQLDMGLQHIAGIIKQQTGKVIAGIPGTGAAGGIAAGLMAYMDVTLVPGTQLVVDASGIKDALTGTDVIITGEGKIDEQSKEGKVISSIAMLAKENKIPVAALCGTLSLDAKGIRALGLDYAISITDDSITLQESMQRAGELLKAKAPGVIAFYNRIVNG